jgi:acetylcholinesterase
MVKQGKMANVPIVIGDMMDEGTIFSLILRKKIRTEEQVKDWIKTVLFPKATDAEVDKLLQMYPDDQATGSPFNSGDSNNISPQFKRLAAIQGDAWFHVSLLFISMSVSSDHLQYSADDGISSTMHQMRTSGHIRPRSICQSQGERYQ